jgi:hypothetical protein
LVGAGGGEQDVDQFHVHVRPHAGGEPNALAQRGVGCGVVVLGDCRLRKVAFSVRHKVGSEATGPNSSP